MVKGFVNKRVCILTEEEILSFQQLAKRVMGLDLTLSEAENQGSRLIQAMELIMDHKKETVVKKFLKGHNEEVDG